MQGVYDDVVVDEETYNDMKSVIDNEKIILEIPKDDIDEVVHLLRYALVGEKTSNHVYTLLHNFCDDNCGQLSIDETINYKSNNDDSLDDIEKLNSLHDDIVMLETILKNTTDKKYIQSDILQKYIDWDNIYKMHRYAGGHDVQMKGLFKDATLIGHWNEGDYQGSVATCVKLSFGTLIYDYYVIYNDYYGSCSGCDAWEDATDNEIKTLCTNLANSAFIFKTLDDVKEFLHAEKTKDESYSWSNGAALNLLEKINKNE